MYCRFNNLPQPARGVQMTNDSVSAEGIGPFLYQSKFAENIRVFPTIDSTNREAKDQALHEAAHGTVIIADSQTQGKGRFGRAFFSPPGGGLYMSFILSADRLGFANPTAVTVYAAVCVCEAVEAVCGMKPSIKWVNDIFLNGKKICGILAEATTDVDNRGAGKIILGIGVNVSTKTVDFPEELRSAVSSLYPDGNARISRNQLAAEIINRILAADRPSETEIFERYRNRLFILGSYVNVIQGKEEYRARALDIDGDGHLLVQMGNGEIRTLLSGEVRLIP